MRLSYFNQAVARSKRKPNRGLIQRAKDSKKAFALAATLFGIGCSLDRSALDLPIDVQTQEATVDNDSNTENRTDAQIVRPPVDTGVIQRDSAVAMDVRQITDASAPEVMDAQVIDVQIVTDSRPVDTITTDTIRLTDSATDSGRSDSGLVGCTRCASGVITPTFGWPRDNSLISNGYSFVRPFSDARVRVNCAANGSEICTVSFGRVGDIRTCTDGPNSIRINWTGLNSTAGTNDYMMTIACH